MHLFGTPGVVVTLKFGKAKSWWRVACKTSRTRPGAFLSGHRAAHFRKHRVLFLAQRLDVPVGLGARGGVVEWFALWSTSCLPAAAAAAAVAIGCAWAAWTWLTRGLARPTTITVRV